MESGLDTFKITIDPTYAGEGEDLSMDKIAFTSNPAIKVKGFAFNSEVKPHYFADSPKMRIVSPAMIPMEIYRNDDMGEYYVQFTQDEIENIHKKFMMNLNNQNKFNLEHSETEIVPAYILECWLVGKDPKLDRSFSEFNIDVPTGTLMMVSQITDKAYYEKLIQNGQVGFSIEGLFGLKFNELGGHTPELETKNKQTMSDQLTLPDGEHTIEGKIYVVKDGAVTEIKDAPVAEAQMAEDPTKVACEEVVAETETEVETPEETTAPVALAVDETEVMAIVQPKLDEVYGAIADLKALIESQLTKETQEEGSAPVQMSAHQKYTEVINFANK